MKNKTNNYLLPVLVVAAVVYVLTMLTIVKAMTIPALILMAAECAILIVVSVYIIKIEEVVSPSQEDVLKNKEEAETDKEKILTLEQEKLELAQRIEALEKEIEDNTLELEKKLHTMEAEKKNLQNKLDILAGEPPKKADKKEVEAFLPPIEEDEKENETIDIIKIAGDTIEELKDFAREVGINILISTSDESLLVRGNISRMRIMFRNIIDNSIKYMNRTGNLIITISNIGDDIFIVLKDNGNGLSEDETKHIFELNYQGSNRISGNGLGLTQAKAIVDYYGGTIYAKSNIGRGMGIYIQLPTT